jgi:DNA-binding IclR family transcriptional regulator
VRTIAAEMFSDGKTVAVMGVVGTTATISDDISSHAAKTLKRVAAELSEQFATHGRAAADAVGDVVVSTP